MTIDDNAYLEDTTATLDCGDGVPALTLERSPHETRPFPFEDNRRPHVTAKAFAISATVIGQLMIALSVAAGGSATVGIFAAMTLLICGLSIVSTDVVNPQR